MVKIVLNGCNGKMGHYVSACVDERENAEIVAGVDLYGTSDYPYPVYKSYDEVKESADVIIDFSNPSAVPAIIDYCKKTGTALVECTTGLGEDLINELKASSASFPVFFSANMSIGVNLICEISKMAANVLGDTFDIEIVEAHHNQKLDAPSGTALMIADAIKEELNYDAHYEYNRQAKREKRSKTEIGIHAVRGGTIVGEHEIIFAGNDEIIKISHSARSKALFATGAVNAAMFIKGKEPRMYNMSDMLK